MKDLSAALTSSLAGMLSAASEIGVITHTHPDGDAVGSAVAMYRYLRECLGKDACIMLADAPPEAVSFLTEGCAGDVLRYDTNPEKVRDKVRRCDLLVFLDLNSISRTGQMAEVFDGATASRILVDHHLNPAADEFQLIFSETEISSASELLYHILKTMPDIGDQPGRLPHGCLEAVMTGLTTDTNNFANSVFPSTFRTASELIAAGVDRDMILMHVYNSYPERRIRLMGEMLSRNLTITSDGVAYMILDGETIRRHGIEQGETEAFVNIPLTIGKVCMSIFVKDYGDMYRVSIRSKAGVSANRLAMKYFSGGGHEQASGGKIPKEGDTSTPQGVASYIERVTAEFFADEN